MRYPLDRYLFSGWRHPPIELDYEKAASSPVSRYHFFRGYLSERKLWARPRHASLALLAYLLERKIITIKLAFEKKGRKQQQHTSKRMTDRMLQ